MNGLKRGSVPLVPIHRIFFRAIAWWPMTDRRAACAGGQRPIFRPVLDPRPPHGYRPPCPKARLDGFVRASPGSEGVRAEHCRCSCGSGRVSAGAFAVWRRLLSRPQGTREMHAV